MKWPSFEFIFTLVLIDSILPIIEDVLLKEIDWWILLSLFGVLCILCAVYFRQLWSYKLAALFFGAKVVSAIIFVYLYLKDIGLAEMISNPRLLIINSIYLLSLLISLPLSIFFIKLWKIYRPRHITDSSSI